ncbi:MAG: SpoIIE family protein phosphatase [Akkermansia sp.]
MPATGEHHHVRLRCLYHLDLETGVMTASTAGDPHPIFWAGRVARNAAARGIALGLLMTLYHNAQFRFWRGPHLFTDGLTEAANQDGKNGRERRLTISTILPLTAPRISFISPPAYNLPAALIRLTISACWASAIPNTKQKRTVNSRFLTFLQPASSSSSGRIPEFPRGKPGSALPFSAECGQRFSPAVPEERRSHRPGQSSGENLK